MAELWSNLGQLAWLLLSLLQNLGTLFMTLGLLLFGIAFALWAIDWRKLAPTLHEGAAIPFALLILAIGGVWGAFSQSELIWMGIKVPNYAWQTMATIIGAGLFLLCGWLQLRYGWFPQTIELTPPQSHGHHHHDDHHHDGHGHGHDEGHHGGHSHDHQTSH